MSTLLVGTLFFIGLNDFAYGILDSCNGTLLTPEVCLPINFAKEVPYKIPIGIWGKYYDIEVLGVNLKAQTMTLAVSATLSWIDPR